MTDLSKSPQRDTFQKEKYMERKEKDGKEPSQDYLDMFDSFAEQKKQREADPEWQKSNMEYDLRSTDWILEKVRTSDTYAQNLYAALCNNDFQQRDVMPILKDQTWSCSWRYAGGIIADMREEGDYIDWYCSGINGTGNDESPYDDDPLYVAREYVPEGMITDEIREDLIRLGWNPHSGDFEQM